MAAKKKELSLILKARNRASAVIAGVTRSVGRLAKGAALMGGVAGGAAAVGVALMVKRQLAAVDASAKLADVLGLTTEQLTGYEHAAAISGVSSAELGTAFRRMEKNISDAGNGLATAKRAIDAVGLSSEELKKLSPDEQFKAIADGFAKIPDQATRAATAQDLFGRSGLKLLKVTELGAKGIEQLQTEAKELGLTFNRIDAAKIEAANDAWTRLKAVGTGVARQFTVRVAPMIEAVVERITEAATEGGGIGPIVNRGVDLMVQGISKAVEFWGDLTSAVFLFRSAALNSIADVIEALETLVKKGGESGAFGLLGIAGAEAAEDVSFTSTVDGLRAQAAVEAESAGAAQVAAAERAEGVKKFFAELQAKANENAAASIGGQNPGALSQRIGEGIAKAFEIARSRAGTATTGGGDLLTRMKQSAGETLAAMRERAVELAASAAEGGRATVREAIQSNELTGRFQALAEQFRAGVSPEQLQKQVADNTGGMKTAIERQQRTLASIDRKLTPRPGSTPLLLPL